MTNLSALAAVSASAVAAAQLRVKNGIKATGAIVHVDPGVLLELIQKSENPLVVVAKKPKWFSTSYAYLTNYKGMFFYTVSQDELMFSESCEMIQVKKIWVPSI